MEDVILALNYLYICSCFLRKSYVIFLSNQSAESTAVVCSKPGTQDLVWTCLAHTVKKMFSYIETISQS